MGKRYKLVKIDDSTYYDLKIIANKETGGNLAKLIRKLATKKRGGKK